MAELLDEAEHEAVRKRQRWQHAPWLQEESEAMVASCLVPWADCEKPISRLASICPNCGRPVLEPSEPDKYLALQFIAGVNKFFAVVVPIVCLIGLAFILDTNDKVGAAKPEIIVPLVVYMIVAPLALVGTAELILLLIGIERNTSTLRRMTTEERKVKEIGG